MHCARLGYRFRASAVRRLDDDVGGVGFLDAPRKSNRVRTKRRAVANLIALMEFLWPRRRNERGEECVRAKLRAYVMREYDICASNFVVVVVP